VVSIYGDFKIFYKKSIILSFCEKVEHLNMENGEILIIEK